MKPPIETPQTREADTVPSPRLRAALPMNAWSWLAALSIFLLNLGLNWRITLPGVTPYRGSIERGYAYMARVFADNPDYLSWNPLQYGGIPMHYVYLPLLPYFNALWLWLIPSADATNIHRVVCAIALFLAPAAAFVLIRDWTGRALPAYLSALMVTLVSPLYFLIEAIDGDRGIMQVPWRIQILIKYGEGPHAVGILLLFVALIFVRRAATRPGFPIVLAAALALAATVLTNWVAGLALAFAVSMLMLAHAGDTEFRHRRVIEAGLLGYLLAAFWLTPSFVAQMAHNWPQDAFGFQFQRLERTAMLAWAAGLLLIRLAFRRLPEYRYACWLMLCTFGYGLPVVLFYRFGINPFPESRRYALEFEFCLLLLLVEGIRILSAGRSGVIRWVPRLAILLISLSLTPHIARFVSHRYQKWQLVDKEQTSDFRVAKALHDLRPTGRVFASGGTRFRLNSWFPIQQVGGVFETGLKTKLPLDISYQIRTDLGFTKGREAEQSILLLRVLAVEYIVTHGPNSAEFYRDYKDPRKFEGVLEKVWEQGDDSIYRMGPVRFAHLVKTGEIPATTAYDGSQEHWYPYVGALLDTTRPQLAFRWTDARRATVTGRLPQGMHVAFAIPWDPNFRAYFNGKPLGLQANSMDLMVTAPLPAEGDLLELRFEPSREELASAALSSLTLLGCLAGLFWRRKA